MFNIQGWSLLSSSGNGQIITLQDGTQIGANSEYSYNSSEDTIEQMSVSGYFSQQVFELNVADTIYAVGTDGEIEFSTTVVNRDTRTVEVSQAASTGDMDGPSTSTSNAVARFNGTTGKLLKNSVLIVSDAGVATGLISATIGNILIALNSISAIDTNDDVSLFADGTGSVNIGGTGVVSGQIKIKDVANSGYLGFKTGTTVASSGLYQLPEFPASSGQVLSSTTGGVLSWTSNSASVPTTVTSGPVTVVVNTVYNANGASLITFNMPASFAAGSFFEIRGMGAGGFLVQANTGQVVNINSSATSSAGSLASTNRYNVIRVECLTANTVFSVISSMGNITVA